MNMRIALLACLVLAAAGCASLPGTGCTAGGQAAVQETLYFGADMPDGLVTPEQWAAFLASTVTPRFPHGLTVLQAQGQWRDASGTIVHEPTWVLQLLHPDDRSSEQSIAAITTAYKTQFRQEAVLRTSVAVCASF